MADCDECLEGDMPPMDESSSPRHRDLKDPVRVAHIFGAMDIGGAELRTLELMESLAKDVRPTYVTLSGREGVLADRIRQSGGVVVPMALDASFASKFVALLRSAKIDIVHSHVATASGAVLSIARIAGVRTRIAHFRSDGDGKADTRRRLAQRRFMRALIAGSATKIVGVSPGALTKGYRRSWRVDERCSVIPNGVRLAELSECNAKLLRTELRVPPDSIIVVHVGRPSPEKNRERLPGILRAMLDAGAPSHLVMIGPRHANLDRAVLDMAELHGVADRISFMGPRDDVQCLLVGADLMVLPSFREGLPGAVLEALATGTSVLASDLPGVRYIQQHLGGITAMDLADDDAAWARQAVRVAKGGRPDLVAARQAFSESVFAHEAALAATRRLYGIGAGR